MSDPTLELPDENGAGLRSNNDWANTQANAIVVTGIPPMGSAQIRYRHQLHAGHYTAVVQGRRSQLASPRSRFCPGRLMPQHVSGSWLHDNFPKR